MYKLKKIPGRTAQTEHGEYLWFGGTSYLGMPYNADFQTLIKIGLDQYGANWGSSRNNNLQLEVYDFLENFLADLAKAPASLTVSSGMIAGQMVVDFLKKENVKTEFIFAPKLHPALWNEAYKIQDSSFSDFIENINSKINNSKATNFTILADSVSSPHFEKYDFEWVAYLPKNKMINLVIDDSHSLGILGENGCGIYSKIKQAENVNLIVVSSLNKALGVPGGVIFAQKPFIDKLKKTAYFSGCSPISPAFAHACTNASNIYNDALITLQKNLKYFNEKIKSIIDFGNTEMHPAYNFNKENLSECLLSKNILVPSFGYPNPNDKPITRLVISSLHSFSDINILAEALMSVYKK